MKVRAYVEPAEPMRGLEVPEEVVEALRAGKWSRVTITTNGHSWKSRVAVMRGRYLTGLSARHRTREEARDARTADRKSPGSAAGLERP